MGLGSDNIYCNHKRGGGERLRSSRGKFVSGVVGAARHCQLIAFILSFHYSDKGSGNALRIDASGGRKTEEK